VWRGQVLLMQLGVVPCLAAAIVVGGYRAGRRAREADAMRVKLDKTRHTTGVEVPVTAPSRPRHGPFTAPSRLPVGACVSPLFCSMSRPLAARRSTLRRPRVRTQARVQALTV
jgi:hypothetical protein